MKKRKMQNSSTQESRARSTSSTMDKKKINNSSYIENVRCKHSVLIGGMYEMMMLMMVNGG